MTIEMDHEQLISLVVNIGKQTCGEYERPHEDFYSNYSAKLSTMLEMREAEKYYKDEFNRIILDLQNQRDELDKEARKLTELLQAEEQNYKTAEAIKNKSEKTFSELEQEKKSFIDGDDARKLLKSKARVRSCAMLTSTIFDYSGPEVSGYIRKNGACEVKGFVLEASRSPEKTTEFLWKKLENIFCSK